MTSRGDITISPVYAVKPTKYLRGGPVGGWVFTITAGARSQLVRSDTRDQARERRARALEAAELLARRGRALELRDAVLAPARETDRSAS